MVIGTFTDVTQKAGVGDPRWSAGAAFVDIDNDGDLDLFVSNYVAFDFNNLPDFGKGKLLPIQGSSGPVRPARTTWDGDSLLSSTTVTVPLPILLKKAGSRIRWLFGMGVIASDLTATA
jgi:hypothetical protein